MGLAKDGKLKKLKIWSTSLVLITFFFFFFFIYFIYSENAATQSTSHEHVHVAGTRRPLPHGPFIHWGLFI